MARLLPILAVAASLAAAPSMAAPAPPSDEECREARILQRESCIAAAKGDRSRLALCGTGEPLLVPLADGPEETLAACEAKYRQNRIPTRPGFEIPPFREPEKCYRWAGEDPTRLQSCDRLARPPARPV